MPFAHCEMVTNELDVEVEELKCEFVSVRKILCRRSVPPAEAIRKEYCYEKNLALLPIFSAQVRKQLRRFLSGTKVLEKSLRKHRLDDRYQDLFIRRLPAKCRQRGKQSEALWLELLYRKALATIIAQQLQYVLACFRSRFASVCNGSRH